jgi:methyl-accepting chemotaxis protein-1 (serine sensor receptor)
VEEAAAAAKSLEEQASVLREAVSVFRLEEEPHLRAGLETLPINSHGHEKQSGPLPQRALPLRAV